MREKDDKRYLKVTIWYERLRNVVMDLFRTNVRINLKRVEGENK